MNNQNFLRLPHVAALLILSAAAVQPAAADGDYSETRTTDDCVMQKKLVRHPGAPGNGRIMSYQKQPCPQVASAAHETQQAGPHAKPRKIHGPRGLRPPYKR